MRLPEMLEECSEEELYDVILHVQRMDGIPLEEYIGPQAYALLNSMGEAMRLVLESPYRYPLEGIVAAYLEVGFELGVRWCASRGLARDRLREC